MKVADLFEDQLTPDVIEFQDAISRYVKQYPKYREDHRDLRKTFTLYKRGKLVDAYDVISRADTFVRELVPDAAWKKMQDAQEAKRKMMRGGS